MARCVASALVRVLALGLVASASLGCSRPLKVAEVEARAFHLASYQTYAWITPEPILIRPGSGEPAIRNVETERAIRAAVDQALAARGLREVEGGAQLLVSFSLDTRPRAQLQGGTTPLNMVADDPATLTRAALTLALFDAGLDEQVWAGTAQQDLEDGDEPAAALAAAVAALAAQLPGSPGPRAGESKPAIEPGDPSRTGSRPCARRRRGARDLGHQT